MQTKSSRMQVNSLFQMHCSCNFSALIFLRSYVEFLKGSMAFFLRVTKFPNKKKKSKQKETYLEHHDILESVASRTTVMSTILSDIVGVGIVATRAAEWVSVFVRDAGFETTFISFVTYSL